MARVTVEMLSKIFKGAGTDNSVLQSFIDTANLLVNEELTSVTPALSATRLQQIELYLAAHFATCTFEKGGVTAKTIDNVEEQYQRISASAKGLQTTRYGQQVVMLDPSGKLGNLSASITRAQFRVMSAPAKNSVTQSTEFD